MKIRNTLILVVLFSGFLKAAIVWEFGGPDITTLNFEKGLDADETDPANWDRITEAVAITRSGDFRAGPLFNPLRESSWGGSEVAGAAPTGTEWAFAGLNGNSSSNILPSNFENLTFAPFRTAFGGMMPERVIGRDAVLHLIEEDVYLAIVFNSWDAGPGGLGGSGGGGFSYTRAVGAIPEPSTVLLASSSLFLGLFRRRRA